MPIDAPRIPMRTAEANGIPITEGSAQRITAKEATALTPKPRSAQKDFEDLNSPTKII